MVFSVWSVVFVFGQSCTFYFFDPIIRLLQDAYSRKNYDKLNEIAKDYSTRYLTKTEEQKLNSLLMAYKEVSTYNDISVNADILFSYFEYTLKKNQINPKPVPIEYEGEVVYGKYLVL